MHFDKHKQAFTYIITEYLYAHISISLHIWLVVLYNLLITLASFNAKTHLLTLNI